MTRPLRPSASRSPSHPPGPSASPGCRSPSPRPAPEQLLSEAKALFHRKEYEESLNTFTHCLAVTEKTRSSRDATVRGAIVHNIASCLHHLGELEAAQATNPHSNPNSNPNPNPIPNP